MLVMQCFMIENPLFSNTQGGIHKIMTSASFLGWVYYQFIHEHPTLNFQLSFSRFIFPLPLLVVHSSLQPFMNTLFTTAGMGFPHFFSTASAYPSTCCDCSYVMTGSAHPTHTIQLILQSWSLPENRGSNWIMKSIFKIPSLWAKAAAPNGREGEIACANEWRVEIQNVCRGGGSCRCLSL